MDEHNTLLQRRLHTDKDEFHRRYTSSDLFKSGVQRGIRRNVPKLSKNLLYFCFEFFSRLVDAGQPLFHFMGGRDVLGFWKPITTANEVPDILEVTASLGVPLKDMGKATFHRHMTRL
jgi:hypothetical protein